MYLILFFTSFLSFADGRITVLPSLKTEQKMTEHNEYIRKLTKYSLLNDASGLDATRVIRPFAEYETAKYVIFSQDAPYVESLKVKSTILENLPSGVLGVIFSYWPVNEGENQYSRYIKSGVAKNIVVGGYNGFWARDGVPVPVYAESASGIVPTLVDAKYAHGFEPDKYFGQFFGANVIKHAYYFEGGNFMNDHKGNCFVVNTERVELIPDSIFNKFYGCQKLNRLPFISGIGHVDERVKFISERIVLTDVIEYERELRALGYEVRLLPRAEGNYETYINSLLVNGTIFLPVFDNIKDQDVIKEHERLGLKVVPIMVDSLPNQGMGSIHCITMTYPEMPKVP